MNKIAEVKWLCSRCVGDYYLRMRIQQEGQRARCSFCRLTQRCMSLTTVSEAVHELFITRCSRDEVSGRGHTPLHWISQFLGNSDEHFDEVAKTIQKYLSDKYDDLEDRSIYYGNDAYYSHELPYSGTYVAKWDELRESLLHESRYFNGTAKQILDEIFDGLNFDLGDSPKAHLPDYMQDRPIVTQIGPGEANTILYRAREARHLDQTREFLASPAKALGPPPPAKARGGRMNATGVSMFYGALEPATCVAEIRAPVGTYVVTGEFEVQRTLRLLDFGKLREATERIPHFHPKYLEKTERDMFLGTFSFEIATPVHPQDEAFGYLPTQAVAEYLAQREDLELDGLLFPSTQTGSKGTNVVLFRSASRVVPSNEEFDVSAIDFGYEEPAIIEVTTRPEELEPRDMVDPLSRFDEFFSDELTTKPPLPEPTLRLIVGTVTVQKVQSVKFELEEPHLIRKAYTDKPEEEEDF